MQLLFFYEKYANNIAMKKTNYSRIKFNANKVNKFRDAHEKMLSLICMKLMSTMKYQYQMKQEKFV